MKLMRKTHLILLTPILAIITIVILIRSIDNAALARQDSLIRAIELPHTVEVIAVRSAIGDSGGNGNHRTLRTVMLVRAEMPEDLRKALTDQGFRPNSIQEANGYLFSSPRGFRIAFEELKNTIEFDGYYFLTFYDVRGDVPSNRFIL